MATYRLIALDVDGTLLNDRDELSRATIEAVQKAVEAGAHIVLCTGRGPAGAIPVRDRLGLKGPVITHNGAATVDSGSRSVMTEYAFDIGEVMSVIRYCRTRSLHCDVSSVWDLFADRAGEEEREMYRIYGVEPVMVPDLADVNRQLVKMTIFGSSAEMDRVERDWPTLHCRLSIIRSGERFIDIMHPQASKGNALCKLAADMGVDRSQVMAVGNYYNDLGMLEFAGLGVAMANSPEDFKRKADAVTLDNNEDGVAHALYRYVL